jgi:PAS domain S-box-containing protein
MTTSGLNNLLDSVNKQTGALSQEQYQRSPNLQSALYQIAAIANSEVSLEALYASIHRIIGELMYAKNFFIALFDRDANLIRLPYFVDELDPDDAPYKPGKGLTEYVIRTGQPLLITAEEHEALMAQGELAMIGPESPIWLGVPLKWKGVTFGAVVLQHYRDPHAYTEQEKELLSFVSGQIAAAIERKRAEERLRESQEMLSLVINNIPQFVSWKDTNLVYLGCNENFARAAGVSLPEQIVGKTDHDLAWTGEEATVYRVLDCQVMNGNSPLSRLVEKQRQAGGKEALLETSRIPLHNADGRVVGVLWTAEDITERAQAEEALRQAQKLESLGILAGGVAHDFNNLLVAILGHTSLALTQLSADSTARSSVEKAVKAAERAADLTRQLLAYSGRGQFEIVALDLNQLIEENLHLFELAVSKQVRLVPHLAEALPVIEADAGQMQQVIMNLILNAAEAIGDRPGTVEVRTGLQIVGEGSGTIRSYTGDVLALGRYVRLEVVDDGSGMDADTLSKIFDPFFSTKFTGRGLGLAAVLGIVRGHQGALEVSSQGQSGTTFRLFFPVAHAPQTGGDKPALETAVNPGQGMVLVIDDEELVLEAARDILELEGIGALTAASGTAGVALYQARQAEIHLVILDLSMPGIDGQETFRRLRQVNPEVQVVLSSGYSQYETGRRFEGQGLSGFLQKPYAIETFLQEVRRHLKS